jgi:hypothetical protein
MQKFFPQVIKVKRNKIKRDMATLIVILFILAIWHLVIESIIMPSVRFSLRCKLFALRDDLRKSRHELRETASENVISGLDHSITTTIRVLPHINFSLLTELQNAIKADDNLNQKVKERIKALDSCKNDEIQRIANEQRKYTSYAFLANISGWAIYLVAPILLVLIIALIHDGLKATARRYIDQLSYSPDREVESLLSNAAQMA